jgi:lysophospholipase L1-like esterase
LLFGRVALESVGGVPRTFVPAFRLLLTMPFRSPKYWDELRRVCGVAALALVWTACDSGSIGGSPPDDDPPPLPAPLSVVTLGDSVMRWNASSGGAIANVIAARTGWTVQNGSRSGARFSAASGRDIRDQYEPEGWDWVVMDGGANDLRVEGGCARPDGTLDELVSADGSRGEFPEFVRSVAADGPRVLVMGYYGPPEVEGEEPNACAPAILELTHRLQTMASVTEGVFFAPATSVIDPANLEHYDADRVHPSREGSRLIGEMLADVLLTTRID